MGFRSQNDMDLSGLVFVACESQLDTMSSLEPSSWTELRDVGP
jgi:hypothetical protein